MFIYLMCIFREVIVLGIVCGRGLLRLGRDVIAIAMVAILFIIVIVIVVMCLCLYCY